MTHKLWLINYPFLFDFLRELWYFLLRDRQEPYFLWQLGQGNQQLYWNESHLPMHRLLLPGHVGFQVSIFSFPPWTWQRIHHKLILPQMFLSGFLGRSIGFAVRRPMMESMEPFSFPYKDKLRLDLYMLTEHSLEQLYPNHSRQKLLQDFYHPIPMKVFSP